MTRAQEFGQYTDRDLEQRLRAHREYRRMALSDGRVLEGADGIADGREQWALAEIHGRAAAAIEMELALRDEERVEAAPQSLEETLFS